MTRTAPGFSLIEMAIVLTILGALLSGLLVALGLKSEISEQTRQALTLHNDAIRHYYAGEFDQADDLFCRLIQQHSDFAQYYRYMLKQVAEKTNVTLVRQGEIS